MRAFALLALALAGCSPVVPPLPPVPPPSPPMHRAVEIDAAVVSTRLSYPAAAKCGAVTTGTWRGLIRDRADGARDLLMSGEVGVKPSATVAIELYPHVMESYPVQRAARLVVTHPPEPTIDLLEPRQVERELTYRGELGIVRLMCGDREIATIRDPREAR